MDQKWMERALELAQRGKGRVSPNPLVGAVVVRDNQCVGEGWHEAWGQAHAEVNALQAAGTHSEAATLYVTLEPCCHSGKTPPCTDLIIQRGIKKVFVAMKDPNPLVQGRGIQKLKDAGIEVVTGLLETQAREINRPFLSLMERRRPFVVMKYAMSMDGKIATASGDSRWISNEASRKMVHQLRHEMAAIMVGVNTVVLDNPLLTTRGIQGNSQCHRIVVDTHLSLPETSALLEQDNGKKVFLATSRLASSEKRERLMKVPYVEILDLPLDRGRVDLRALMKQLALDWGIDSILLEGGAQLNGSMVEEGFVDRVMAFVAPCILGGQGAQSPVGGQGIAKVQDALTLHQVSVTSLEGDWLLQGEVQERRGPHVYRPD